MMAREKKIKLRGSSFLDKRKPINKKEKGSLLLNEMSFLFLKKHLLIKLVR